MKTKIVTALSYCMLAMFLFSIVVQYNDPDPLTWMAVYGAAAVITIAFILHRLHWIFPTTLFLITLLWAFGIEPKVWGQISISDLFSAWEMKSVVIEEGREMGGLLIVAIWCLLLSVFTIRVKNPS